MDQQNDNQDSNRGGTEGLVASPPPHEEQQRYWSQDLRYKKVGLAISAAGFLLIVAGFIATLRQVSINTEQLRLNIDQSKKVSKGIEGNLENAVVTHVTSLDQIFMKKPSLQPYFYAEKAISQKDKAYPEVAATAVMVLDVFDLVSTQNRHFPEFWDVPGAWDEWMIDVFSTSPILRATLDQYPTWYGDGLKKLRQEGQERLDQRTAKTERSVGSQNKVSVRK